MHEFRRPRWIILSIAIVLFIAACVALGLWQLGRLDERRADNLIVTSRLDRAPIDLAVVLDDLERLGGEGFGPEDLEFTRVTATGSFLDAGSVFVRSQVHNSQAGTHGIYALDLGDGSAVLVNVGWFPLGHDQTSVAGLFGDPPVTVSGLLRPTQERPSFGRAEPAGPLQQVARVDIERLQQQIDLPLVDVWIQMTEPEPSGPLPIAAPIPDTDEGPHFSYAIQWFSFALTAAVFYAALTRRELKKARRRRDSPDLG